MGRSQVHSAGAPTTTTGSGKSSIGEGICFALFGHTFSLAEKDLDKVIRWGASRCSIKLDVTTPGGRRYRISRFLDELGNHGASIGRAGEEPMIRGVAEVEAGLKDIIASNRRGSQERKALILSPLPPRGGGLGWGGLNGYVASCPGELARAKEQIVENEVREADIASQIAGLDLKPGHLATLETQCGAEQPAQDEDRRRIAALKAASGLRTACALMVACLMPALAAWGLWGLLGLAPDSPQGRGKSAWRPGSRASRAS